MESAEKVEDKLVDACRKELMEANRPKMEAPTLQLYKSFKQKSIFIFSQFSSYFHS